MQPDIVTFWHGPLDALRRTCLRSQVAAGHKVTVYSFDPIADLPDGVVNAEAEAILPHAFSEKLRPPQPDGSWRDWTTLQFSDFFRMRLMAESAGLWLDADVLLLKPGEIDLAKPYFAWVRRRPLGNSVALRPSRDALGLARCASSRQFGALSAIARSDRAGIRAIDAAGGIDPGLAGAAASPDIRAPSAARRVEPCLRPSTGALRAGGVNGARKPRRYTPLCIAAQIVLRGS